MRIFLLFFLDLGYRWHLDCMQNDVFHMVRANDRIVEFSVLGGDFNA